MTGAVNIPDGDNNHVTLTYRDFATLWSVTVSTARRRVRKQLVSGEWRVSRGNRPFEPVRVILPAGQVPVSAGPVEPGSEPSGEGVAKSLSESGGQFVDVGGRVVLGLLKAQDQIRHLTRELLEGKEAHRQEVAELVEHQWDQQQKFEARYEVLRTEARRFEVELARSEADKRILSLKLELLENINRHLEAERAVSQVRHRSWRRWLFGGK